MSYPQWLLCPFYFLQPQTLNSISCSADVVYVNELTPSGEWPQHLKLRMFGVPHAMPAMANMSMESDEYSVRHAPLMKM
jgi:hypothetical protein